MDSGITIRINLLGKLGSLLKHTTKQNYSIKVTNEKGREEILTRKILHTDRQSTLAVREFHISPMVLNKWITDSCPYWVKPQLWKKFTKEQKIQAYVSSFDEGFGVTYE